ncbi:MAG: YraN family protein [Clostridia bacterium]|nr:YraN family protein [Clostridia bacterium]MBQ5813672.1 YraN family protein [Clostridia bacterium]
MMRDKLVGRYGEKIAADFLRKKGYDILESGFHFRGGEIDIIARKGDTVAFVEVKTRRNQSYLPASTAVGREKQRKIMLTAEVWISRNQYGGQVSFDIIEVYTDDKTIRHIKNAFV